LLAPCYVIYLFRRFGDSWELINYTTLYSPQDRHFKMQGFLWS